MRNAAEQHHLQDLQENNLPALSSDLRPLLFPCLLMFFISFFCFVFNFC